MSWVKKYRVKDGRRLDWKDFDPDERGDFTTKEEAEAETSRHIQRIDELQERLYAENRQALLIVLQGMDTSGKDGTIRHVMTGVNPQSCRVSSFKTPTPEEQRHDFLWRIHREVPPAGDIGIFNRSHYEDVLVGRVHGLVNDELAERRFTEINHFEKILIKSGTRLLKFFLHISKDEQRKRLEERERDPKKRWKASPNDFKERRFWDTYMNVYADALSATSPERAPWYVIPANHKWYRNFVISKMIADTLKEMDPRYPKIPRKKMLIR